MAASWAIIGGEKFSVSSLQAATESAPSDPSDGMNIAGLGALTFWLDAGAGQTITSDVGQLDIYQYDNGVWGLAPAIVLPVPPGSSGHQRVQLGTLTIDNPRGRIAPICNGVSASGAAVTVEILATLVSDRRAI